MTAGPASAEYQYLTLPNPITEIVTSEGSPIVGRERPGYDPIGIRAGSFLFYPSITTGVMYDSNVFAARTNRIDSTVLFAQPAFRLKSNWSQHEFNAYATTLGLKYTSASEANRVDAATGFNARIDVTRDLAVTAAAEYGYLHEEPATGIRGVLVGGLLDPLDSPVAYHTGNARLAVNKQFNRLTVSIGGTAATYNYLDARTLGDILVDQDYRDGNVYTLVSRVGYELGPGTSAFVESEWNRRNFHDSTFDSSGYRLATGVRREVTRLVSGEVFVGYAGQDYESEFLRDQRGLNYGAKLYWTPTPLMSVTLFAAQRFDESGYSTIGAVGTSRRVDEGGVRVDYEVLRNLILTGTTGARRFTYVGDTREDSSLLAGIGITYIPNRWLSVSLGYKFEHVDSTIAAFDYDRHRVALSLRASY